MRVLYVCDNYPPMIGGAEYANRSICEGLAARGHDVTVVTHRPKAPCAGEESQGRLTIVRIPCAGNRHVFTGAALEKTFQLARTADIVHATTYNAAPPAWLAARLRRRPILLTVWESWLGRWRYATTASAPAAAVYESLERAIFSLPYDRYVAISNATAADLRRALPRRTGRIDCVPLGFDAAAWRAPGKADSIRAELGLRDSFMVVGYGRPGVSKGFGYLIEAAALAAADIPNLKLVLVLSEAPQYRPELQALKRQAGPDVVFLPSQPRDRLVQIVKAADCAAVPSVSEGFGYTTLEACASGVPVVATRVGSIPDVIGGRFVLVEPRNAEALARGIVDVRAGKVSLAPERAFSWDATLDAYEAIYDNLAAAH